ncbi:hypothetical protein BV25DRAFT_338438 [Artomyces pyxidatus]|uniref:Uncharacterized protein n=1 Tax=Artomyces pyxidatus TaxID=48021 RepID=A0ACB8T6E6_9AGAM|nr:hypothetical protein BV25DRAFT_338438 [Artomyces pyxidatus]
MDSTLHRNVTFPPELLYDIIARVFGDYICDIVLTYLPDESAWDPVLPLLHVSHAFRVITTKILKLVWEDAFICDAGDTIKDAVASFQHFSLSARTFPDSLDEFGDLLVKFNEHACPMLDVCGYFLWDLTLSCELLRTKRTQPEATLKMSRYFNVNQFLSAASRYANMPTSVRYLLVLRVMEEFVERRLAWSRLAL